MIKTTPVQNKALVLQAFEIAKRSTDVWDHVSEGETLVAKFVHFAFRLIT